MIAILDLRSDTAREVPIPGNPLEHVAKTEDNLELQGAEA